MDFGHCRTVTGRFHDGLWDYGLRCEAACKTFSEPQLAHALAARAAERAAVATGQKLSYQAFGDGAGRVEGAVRVLAGRQP